MADVAPARPQTSSDNDQSLRDWRFVADIGNRLNKPARELFEKYSHIPPEQVESHILDVRNRAWKVWPYPCIGRFRFLDLSISRLPVYPDIIKRLKDGQVFLDIGCCFGQVIRKLVYDGAPSENIYGADFREDFIELGYELFKDKATLRTKFIIGDIFDPSSALKQIDGKIDIIYASSFFHLFNWENQVRVGKRLVQLLSDQEGSLILGHQVGSPNSGEYPHRTNSSGTMYRHDRDSFKKMWQQIGDETGTSWNVDAELYKIEASADPMIDVHHIKFLVKRQSQ